MVNYRHVKGEPVNIDQTITALVEAIRANTDALTALRAAVLQTARAAAPAPAAAPADPRVWKPTGDASAFWRTADPGQETPPAPAPAESPADRRTAAITLASRLVAQGHKDKVKAALAQLGAARLSELPDEKLPAFLAALES